MSRVVVHETSRDHDRAQTGMSKQTTHRFHMQRSNLKKLNEVEGK
jgi:hypothetical protein